MKNTTIHQLPYKTIDEITYKLDNLRSDCILFEDGKITINAFIVSLLYYVTYLQGITEVPESR